MGLTQDVSHQKNQAAVTTQFLNTTYIKITQGLMTPHKQ